jgi:hypothetical protein
MKNSITFGIIGGILILILFMTDSIGFLALFGLIILLAVIAQIWYSNEFKAEQKEERKKLNTSLNELDDFNATKRLVGNWGLIAIDDSSNQIAVKEENGKLRKYNYTDILSCEVILDGETTYKKSNIIVRAIAGGVLAGGAGAIVGGLSGKDKKDSEIKNLDFKIVFKDTQKPNFKIKFFDAWEETARTKKSIKVNDLVYGPIYQKANKELENWKNIFEIIIDGSNNSNSNTIQSSSISDELIKLNELKQKGILTDVEFEEQKKKILN